jgi:2-iminobutanoate/2-iminopropanoate deaminase
VKLAIQPAGAAKPIGPYSPAMAVDGLLFCSGQGPMDPATGLLVEGGIGPQTERTLRNLGALLEAAGLGLGDVVKTTCYLRDMDDFKAFNEVYATFFTEPYPARTTIQAARLPLDIAVEVEAIALRRETGDGGGV